MSGSLLSPDQIAKVNAAYVPLLAHVRSLLAKDNTAYGLMQIHLAIESLNTTELYQIFAPLSWLSPIEKKALVRTAVYAVLTGGHATSATPRMDVPTPVERPVAPVFEEPKTFTPPQFKLNVNRSEAFHGQAPADTPPPAPVVTSTHTSKVAANIQEGNKRMAEHADKLEAAAREVNAVKPIEIMAVPEDATLPQNPE